MVGAAGWAVIGPDARIAAWANAARGPAIAAIAAEPNGWRCDGTWHAGVDALPNDASGDLGDVAFPWDALPLLRVPLHRGQVSVIRPGYPRAWAGETEAAFGYRLRRDAAHLDGVLPMGPARQRMIREPHAWILGLPLNSCSADAAPLVIWEGSHAVIRAALKTALDGIPETDWDTVDLTLPYKAARQQVFAACPRRLLPALPGQATLIHRLCLHGMAPWGAAAQAPPEGRMIAYFRPQLRSIAAWLQEA
jgi:hypothetical protein